ncbi:methylase of polypeptide subunit release factors [Nocardia tenerifensis]|uniref:Methylase of polypeptide subunit release factors n=1 Tax=Nocardia tenerifensis TaxID=228006 RepID=A0A318K251_9NOCA|nr:class I SAM-dependent methyltransferase [Nocardia tenerifensis]PXX65351.1 methylase of polypeptide subunit release factors [Nocardia tenerifensis]
MSTISWTEADTVRTAPWHSESATPMPTRITVADDRMTAATAYRLACEGTGLLWRGDYHNGRQLLQAMSRRVDRKGPGPGGSPAESFRLQRRARNHRARVLGKLLVQLEDDHTLALRRAPDVRAACDQAYGTPREPMLIAMTELLGVLGAAQWRAKGVPVPALDAVIHPHYGVFSPVRGEYVDLVARAPIVKADNAFDLGTGTGVLAAVLARRGVGRVVGTDDSPRALTCARENVERLGLSGTIDIVGPALFPDGRADLIVCNPPWLPARPTSALEHGVYDEDSGMLRAFLSGLSEHLEVGGEGWLVLSDLAERLGLRTRADLLALIDAAGLRVVDKIDTAPRHPRAQDRTDPLHAARAAEVTSLWRLVV